VCMVDRMFPVCGYQMEGWNSGAKNRGIIGTIGLEYAGRVHPVEPVGKAQAKQPETEVLMTEVSMRSRW
jgi:hypothetical protein